jgi:hypothetical protein
LQQRKTVHLALENSKEQGSRVRAQGSGIAPIYGWNRGAAGCV